MTEKEEHPAASHYAFPYFFANAGTEGDPGVAGINFRAFGIIYYEGDLLIYYGDMRDSSYDFVDCYCSRWDVQNYSVIIETWLKEDDLNLIQDNIRPGAVGELYTILGRPRYYDSTWSSDNTLRMRPNPYIGKNDDTGVFILGNTGNLSNMRNDTLIYVKNTTSSPIVGSNGWINYKIEGMISGTRAL